MTLSRIVSTTAIVVALSATLASAHPTHGTAALSDGLTHPVTGLDHLLAIVGVGLWAAQLGGRARWAVPAAFLATMAAGAGLQLGGVGFPLVDPVILASVCVLGLLIATASRLPTWTAATVVAVFALFHGAAHAAEMSAGTSAVAYFGGFLATTAGLLAVAAGASVLAATTRRETPLVRWAGGAMTAAGLLLVAGVL